MKDKNESVRIVDIARAAKVSHSTVSRALKNHHSISEKTCCRIQKLASKMGYSNNPYVGAYMHHVRQGKTAAYRANVICLDASSTHSDWKRSGVVRDIFDGAKKRGEELGFSVQHFYFYAKENQSLNLTRMLMERNVSGVLVFPNSVHFLEQDFLHPFLEFPCVCLGMKLKHLNISFAMNDQFLSSQMAHQKLIEMGYRRVGFVLPDFLEPKLDYRFTAGFHSVRAFEKVPRSIEPHFVREARVNLDALGQWIEKYRLDAVLSVRDNVLGWLRELGYRVPEDIGFASLGARREKPDVAGVDQNSLEVGKAGMNQLVELINRNERGGAACQQGVVIEGEWVNGKTVVRQ